MVSTEERVCFPQVSTIDRIEEIVSEKLRFVRPETKIIILDFSESIYIDVATLIYTIEFISARKQEGIKVRIKLPKALEARNFLRSWKFPEAIWSASGERFIDIVCESDHKYFGEIINSELSGYSGDAIGNIDEKYFIGTTKYFSLKTLYNYIDTDPYEVSLTESERWEDRRIIAILNKLLINHGGAVSTNIIFESIMNALRHPNSKIVQIGSRIYKPKITEESHFSHYNKGKGLVEIVIWDNGTSMAQTLRNAIEEGKQIKYQDCPKYNHEYIVVIIDDNIESNDINTHNMIEGLDYYVLKANFIPTIETSEELLLASTIFPGITRDIEFMTDRAHPIHRGTTMTLPGMGLFSLIQTAIETYKGSVSFRTMEYFMNVKSIKGYNKWGHKDVRYRIKIHKKIKGTPKFIGNMITIRLPIKSSIT